MTNIGETLTSDDVTSYTPQAKRRRYNTSTSTDSSSDMDINLSSSESDMSIELKEDEELEIRNIDQGASLEESPEYAEDIDNYLRKLEEQFKPKAGYMLKQRYITLANRSTVTDWMFEICDEFRLTQKIFQLGVTYVDRFLSKMSMSTKHLQLLGTAALFIACKVEEQCAPGLAASFVWLTDNTYSVDQLFKMEVMILNTLDYEINSPTTRDFQDRFLKASDGDSAEQFFTEYLCNRSQVHGDTFLRYTPSLVTAAAVGLSRVIQTPSAPLWTPTLTHYTHHTYPEVRECMSELLQLYKLDSNPDTRCYPAVWNKYCLPRFKCVLEKQPVQSIPLYH